ncbi:MAG: hypothetical protein PHV83_05315, partial [Bacteroidales bacterium]|nr:hypothetical protein [Bacteroidales bacterium]
FLDDIEDKFIIETSLCNKSINPFQSKTSFVRNTPKTSFTTQKPLPKPIGGEEVKKGDYYISMKVGHDKFGYGEIINLDGNGDDMKAEVKFEAFGTKTLVLRFAKLKKI